MIKIIKINGAIGDRGLLETELDRIQDKHADSDFGMSLLDELSRNWETCSEEDCDD